MGRNVACILLAREVGRNRECHRPVAVVKRAWTARGCEEDDSRTRRPEVQRCSRFRTQWLQNVHVVGASSRAALYSVVIT